jgi:DNA ligase D-like protein (predicted 3'-phosphoesterase)
MKGMPIFVIHEHRARTHHFDLRLEVDGVLKSWAVPKGPSTDPRENRLAVAVEDHPLDYADFEGSIPEESYGAGAVIVWDAGTYRSDKQDDDDAPVAVTEQLERGQLEVWLEGRKIRGGWALIHAKVGGNEAHWLLIKKKDEGADARRNPVRTERESVLSGKTVDDIESDDENGGDEDDRNP